MTNTNPPWNKGKRGIEAGWTEERRKKASRRHKKWLREHPENPLGKKGPRPELWRTGPDKKVRQHYYRFLKARNQARFWAQEWTILWEDYLDIYKTMTGRWSRKKRDMNLARIDTSEGWHLWNVQLMKRSKAMRRKTTNKRITPKGLHSRSIRDPKTKKWRRR
jgi:hypothetical protein